MDSRVFGFCSVLAHVHLSWLISPQDNRYHLDDIQAARKGKEDYITLCNSGDWRKGSHEIVEQMNGRPIEGEDLRVFEITLELIKGVSSTREVRDSSTRCMKRKQPWVRKSCLYVVRREFDEKTIALVMKISTEAKKPFGPWFTDTDIVAVGLHTC